VSNALRRSDIMCDVVTKFGPWAIVAGASEGLGAAFAHLLASHGLNLILIARREAPLASLAAALEKTYGISVAALPMDLSTEAAVQRLDDATATRDVGLLVYNAAFSTKGDFCETPIDQLEMIVSLNCAGLVRCCRLLAPRLAKKRRGGLLLMSSMSGFHGHAAAATYAASKAFTTSLAEGLWSELTPNGVTVRVCAAGAIYTPNFIAATPAATQSLAVPMQAEEVARCALRAMLRTRWLPALPPLLGLNECGPLAVPGWLNYVAYVLMRYILSPTMAVQFMSSNVRRVWQL